jgi:hypothetical protein
MTRPPELVGKSFFLYYSISLLSIQSSMNRAGRNGAQMMINVVWAYESFFLLFYVPNIFFLDYNSTREACLMPNHYPHPAPLLQAPAHRVDKGMTNSRKRHQGGAGRPVKWGTCKVRTQSLNTCHVTLTTQPQGTTDGAKVPAPRPLAAACGLQVHTATTIHTHPTLTWMTQHLPPRRRATACQVDNRCFGHNKGLERQGTHLPSALKSGPVLVFCHFGGGPVYYKRK